MHATSFSIFNIRCILFVSPYFGSLGRSSIFQYLSDIAFADGASLPASSKSSCNYIKCMAYDLVSLFFGWLLFLSKSGAFCVISPTGVGPTWPLGGVAFDILFEVSLLDQSLDLLLELVVVFYVVSFNFMEFIPYVWLRSHNVDLWGWRRRDIMQMEKLPPNLFTTSVQGREALYYLSYLLECNFILDGWGIVALLWMSWAFGTRYALF